MKSDPRISLLIESVTKVLKKVPDQMFGKTEGNSKEARLPEKFKNPSFVDII